MKLPHSQKQTARMAFTLVELLVVIAIIVVLVGMLMVGVFKALDTAYEARTRTDITQIAAAVESFKTKYQVSWVPSRIRLREILNTYDVNNANPAIAQLERDSIDYLQKVWPRLSGTTIPINGTPAQWVDWNGDGVPDSQAGVPPNFPNLNLQDPTLFVDLEGEQCLVFFLGGIPQYNASTNTFTATGFSTNASNPSQPTGDRVPPFFDFKSDRLRPWPGTAGLFPSYLDGYGKTPYAYFSSYKTANGYNRYIAFGNSDCQSLPATYVQAGVTYPTSVWPYAQTLGASSVYHNAQTFQLISAGKDTFFGPGSNPAATPPLPAYGAASTGPFLTWAPSYAGQAYTQGQPGGYDDIGNFYDRLLGVPTQ